jgi:type I protein arginine methyltransferase
MLIQNFMRWGLRNARAVKAKAMSSKSLSSLFYDFDNVGEFSNLFEHEKMLADSVRVDTYAAAISRHIKPGDVVIDLGTGTGILAILAARQGAKVYAIDHSDFIHVAEQIAKQNGIDNIQFLKMNSRDFVCPEKADYILHEQIGDDLFDENMIVNLLDLKQRALKDNGAIFPGRFELFLEPVALKNDYRVPFIWETPVHGIDYGFLRNHPDVEKYKRPNYASRYIDKSAFDYFLSEPEPILSVDLNKLSGTDSIATRFSASRLVTHAGRMEGLYLYFRVVFDGESHFDTAPDHTHTSWGNRMLRCTHHDYAVGETISFQGEMGDIRFADTWSCTFNPQLGGTFDRRFRRSAPLVTPEFRTPNRRFRRLNSTS